MFNIDFFEAGAIDVRRDEPELKINTPPERLFEFLTEDMLLVHFKNFTLDISCFGYINAWNDSPNYSIETYKKIIFIIQVTGLEYNKYDVPELIFVCRYLSELRENILKAIDFIKKAHGQNKMGLFNIDFSPGYILVDRPQINLDISFEYLIYLIRRKNILKVIFPGEMILKSEWVRLDKSFDFYNKNNWNEEFFTKGYFSLKVIKNGNLKNPVFKSKCKTLKELKRDILNALIFIKEKLHTK